MEDEDAGPDEDDEPDEEVTSSAASTNVKTTMESTADMRPRDSETVVGDGTTWGTAADEGHRRH